MNKTMVGIVLAGGSGSRLWPMTKGVSKQLLPLYDKPMIYFPISTLMLAGIRDILIITTEYDQTSFKRLLGDGSQFGINLYYAVQKEPNGLAEAFIIGKDFIGDDDVCLVLGDNIFYGSKFADELITARKEVEITEKAKVFGYWVRNPERYGVAEFSEKGKCLSIEEKPAEPKSNYAVVGLYFYPNDVVAKAANVVPSARGELEITSINQMYLEEGKLTVQRFPRGFAWLDTGTFESLSDAGNFVETIEKRQGLQIACLEEIGYNNGWLSKKALMETAETMKKNDYGKYLFNLVNRK